MSDESNELEIKKLNSKIKYAKRLFRQIIFDIQQNQPKEFLQLDIYMFSRYIVRHSPIEIKYIFKKILPQLEQYCNDMSNTIALQQLIEWFSKFSIKEMNRQFLVLMINDNQAQSSVEQKLEEEKIIHFITSVNQFLKENKYVSYLELKKYLISNQLFIPEDILIKELQKLEDEGIVEIQYTLKDNGNIPLLIRVKEK